MSIQGSINEVIGSFQRGISTVKFLRGQQKQIEQNQEMLQQLNKKSQEVSSPGAYMPQGQAAANEETYLQQSLYQNSPQGQADMAEYQKQIALQRAQANIDAQNKLKQAREERFKAAKEAQKY